jgi:hypothetical protein
MNKKYVLFLIPLLLLNACDLFYYGPDIDTLHRDYAEKGLIDAKAPVQASSSIFIKAPSERVWNILSDVSHWSDWLPDVADVDVSQGITAGSPFTWRGDGTKIKSRFAVVIPDQELSWTGVAFGAKAIDRHVLKKKDGGTEVFTEESMSGVFLTLFYDSKKLKAAQIAWLAALKQEAEREKGK